MAGLTSQVIEQVLYTPLSVVRARATQSVQQVLYTLTPVQRGNVTQVVQQVLYSYVPGPLSVPPLTPVGSYRTLEQINTVFAWAASVINGKIDRDVPSLTGDLLNNLQPIINLADAIDPTDVATVRQVKAKLGV